MSVTTIFTDGISRADPSNIIKGTAIVLLLFGVYHLVLNSRQRAMNDAIPRYEWDTRSASGAKKRWMWDSLSLLREGYAKVHDPVIVALSLMKTDTTCALVLWKAMAGMDDRRTASRPPARPRCCTEDAP